MRQAHLDSELSDRLLVPRRGFSASGIGAKRIHSAARRRETNDRAVHDALWAVDFLNDAGSVPRVPHATLFTPSRIDFDLNDGAHVELARY